MCHFRDYIRLQRAAVDPRIISGLRNSVVQVQANQRLQIRWHVHLQRCGSLYDNSACDASHW